MMTENDPALEAAAKAFQPPAETQPAKKAAAKKAAAAPAPAETSGRGETIKYVYAEDAAGHLTALVGFGSEGALFDYVRENRKTAFKFIDVPKGVDVIGAIKDDA